MDDGKERRRRPGDGRIVAIDILRGVAILWVRALPPLGRPGVLPGASRASTTSSSRGRCGTARGPWRIFTAFTDLLFRDGFEGVPLFMMISGISLTIAAYRAGDALSWPRFFAAALPQAAGAVLGRRRAHVRA